MSGRKQYTTVIWPAVGASLLVMQLVYWLKIFSFTSFYVTLFVESFIDIRYFLLILIIILMTFTISVTVVQNNANKLLLAQEGDYLEDEMLIITERIGLRFLDAFYTQWLLGLGEFELLAIADESEHIVWED
jgi:hypothetical protein